MSAPVWSVQNRVAWNYICVVDASLTEVTADIYRYNNTAVTGLPLLELEASKVFPGLGTVAKLTWREAFDLAKRHEGHDDEDEDEEESEDDESASDDEHEQEETRLEELLDSLVEFSKKTLPEQQLSRTPLFFHGTGNVRSLDMFGKHKLMRGACTYLQQHSHMLLKDCSSQVSAIHEDVEGLLTWLTINYENSTLSEGLSGDIASIVLNNGGSSVAYRTDVDKSLQYKVAVAGSMFDVHVDSNDALGLGDAWEKYARTHDTSCYNPGRGPLNGTSTTNGTGSYDDCAKNIASLLKDVPSAPSSYQYHASGEWSRLANLFESEQSARDFCATEWSQIDASKYAGVSNLEQLCFDVVYAQSLETKLFAEAPMTPLTEYSPESWTKGRALLYAAAELSTKTTGIQTNVGSSSWQFSNDVKRPKLGDWADRLDSKSHRAYGGLVFLAVLVGIIYLLLGKTKRENIKAAFWNRVRGYKNISVEDFELDERRASDDEFDV